MARPKQRRAKQPLPPPLPPETRTVGQLVAETIRTYRDNFWQSLPLGLSVAILTQISIAAGGARTATVQGLEPTGSGGAVDVVVRPGYRVVDREHGVLPFLAGGGALTTAVLGSLLLTLSYVGASAIVSERRLDARTGLGAYALGAIAFLPAPFLALLFVLPAIAWLAFVGLVVPVAVVERTTHLGAAFSRATRLARADYIHAVGGLATLAIVYFLTRLVLFFLLKSAGESTERIAVFLADLVISPILFLGAALLYFDQAARASKLAAPTEKEP